MRSGYLVLALLEEGEVCPVVQFLFSFGFLDVLLFNSLEMWSGELSAEETPYNTNNNQNILLLA